MTNQAFDLAEPPEVAKHRFDAWLSGADDEVAQAWREDERSLAAIAVIFTADETMAAELLARPALAGRMLDPVWLATPTREAVRERARAAILDAASFEEAAAALRRLGEIESIRANWALLRGSWTATQASIAIDAAERARPEVERLLDERWPGAQTGGGMGYPLHVRLLPGWEERRGRIRELHVQVLQGKQTGADERSRIAAALGQNAASGLRWIDSTANPEAAYRTLCENDDALHRFLTIVESAPALLASLGASPKLSDAVLGGMIESAKTQLGRLSAELPPPALAATVHDAIDLIAARWVLEPAFDLGAHIAQTFDDLLRHVCGRLALAIDVFATGSYGSKSLSLGFDLEVLALAEDHVTDAPTQLATLIDFVGGLARHGCPARARPVGVTRSYGEFQKEELETMGLLERFRLGDARLIWGDDQAARMVAKAGVALPLTPERLRELVAVKKRLESEEVAVQHRRRDLAYGIGGLADLDWLVHLFEMRFPTATHAGSTHDFETRVNHLAGARLVNAVERDEILEARRHLLEVRHRLLLLDLSRDLVPENPDKLGRLASAFGYADGNDFLAYHERVIDTVRGLYQDALERLKA